MKTQNFVAVQPTVAPSTPNVLPSSHNFTGLEFTTAAIAISSAIFLWVKSELGSKKAAADAETALIKSLQKELTDKDEEIDKQRILIWRLEKEVRILRQTMEYSGGPSFQPSDRAIN